MVIFLSIIKHGNSKSENCAFAFFFYILYFKNCDVLFVVSLNELEISYEHSNSN
jgi:hypothetical protein